MKAPVIDTSRFEQTAASIAHIAQRHRSQGGGKASEALYYELMAGYYARIQRASREGQPLVAHGAMVPPELLYALDIAPMLIEATSTGTVASLKIQDEMLRLGDRVGWGLNICSSRRVEAAMLVKGWLPRPDAIIWSNNVCDAVAKSGLFLQNLYDIPGFFLDRPYGTSARDKRYYAEEIEELGRFLQGFANRTLDVGRLHEVMNNAWKTADLHREIYELRGARPCPMSNRQGMQVATIGTLYSGTHEGLNYFLTVRDELQGMVAKGIGYASEEKHRLISLFPTPIYALKLLDWMEREHGVMIVSEPLNSCWGDWELQPADLFGSLAAKCFAMPNSRQLHGPAHVAAIFDSVKAAVKNRADGAIYWANITCPQCLALIRLLSDALSEQAGIPTLVLRVDVQDPSTFSHEDIKSQLEVFLKNLSVNRHKLANGK